MCRNLPVRRKKLSDQIETYKKSGEQLEHRKEEALQKLSDQREKYHRTQSNYDTLRNMAERYDGYGFGIKKVMEQKRRVSGIIGVVSDIIKVEPKFEAAIETALGGSIQNVVTDSQETARKLISFLRAKQVRKGDFSSAGRSAGKTFSRPEALKEKGVVGIASRLASYDDRYRHLFASLLGQVLVVENMEAGIAIANKYHHSLRIVTMEGDSLNRGGSMTGGAFKSKGKSAGTKQRSPGTGKETEKNFRRTCAG